MQENQTTSSVPTESVPVKYAGFWVRYVAFTVDSVIAGFAVVSIYFIFGGLTALVGIDNMISIFGSYTFIIILIGVLVVYVLAFVLFFGYFILMTYYKQATLGKMLAGIVVKSDDFQKISLNKILLREVLGRIIINFTFNIGYLVAAFTEKKQGLHDIISHSVVVYKDPTKKLSVGFKIAAVFTALLPVIAIAVMLSSVVLLSLSEARTEARDSAIRSDLLQTAPLMEVYFAGNDTYSTADDCDSGAFNDPMIGQVVSKLKAYNVICKAADTSYAISAFQNDGIGFCIDQTSNITTGIAGVDEEGAYCGI